MKHPGSWFLLSIAAWALPFAARAQVQVQAAYTATSVNVRAGPAGDYPIVAVLPPGFQVGVAGCLSNYSWCDVLAGPSRGWVYAGNLNYPYQNAYVPLLTYGPVIGVAVLGFTLDDYWGRHYHDRPWYGERQRWRNHPAPPPRFSGPRPLPPRATGPGPHERRRDSNPSGSVLPVPSAPPRQGPPRRDANPSGSELPVPRGPHRRLEEQPRGERDRDARRPRGEGPGGRPER